MNAIASRASGKSSSQCVDKLGIEAPRDVKDFAVDADCNWHVVTTSRRGKFEAADHNVLVFTAPRLPRTGANAAEEESPAMARKMLELLRMVCFADGDIIWCSRQFISFAPSFDDALVEGGRVIRSVFMSLFVSCVSDAFSPSLYLPLNPHGKRALQLYP